MAVKGKSISDTNKIVADLLDIPILYENLDSATYDAIIGNSYSRTGGTVRTNTFYSDLDQMNYRNNDYLDSGIEDVGDVGLAGGGQSAEEIIANSSGDSGANWSEILNTGVGIVDGIISMFGNINGTTDPTGNTNTNSNTNTNNSATTLSIELKVMIGVVVLVLGWFVYNKVTN